MANFFKNLENKKSGFSIDFDESKLCWNEQGLIPVIAQEISTKEVLMLAWMNKESLRITLQEGKACYYSRSRAKLWLKGEESGCVQALCSISADCDGDVLLMQVKQTGNACHTGRKSCFYNLIKGGKLFVGLKS